MSAGHGTSITLTAYVSGGGPSSAAAFVEANPAPPPAGPNALDTILILRLEDGADIFISLRGTFLPSCCGMDLDRWAGFMFDNLFLIHGQAGHVYASQKTCCIVFCLFLSVLLLSHLTFIVYAPIAPCRLLTFGDNPIVAVEQLDAEGQQLLQQGLQPPPLPAPAVQQLVGQVRDLGLGLDGPDGGAAAGDDAGGRASGDLGKRQAQSLTGVESRVPKELQRLVHFLEVGVAVAGVTTRVLMCPAGVVLAGPAQVCQLRTAGFPSAAGLWA